MENKVVVEVEDKVNEGCNETKSPGHPQNSLQMTPCRNSNENTDSGFMEHTNDDEEKRSLTSHATDDPGKITHHKDFPLFHKYCLGQFNSSTCIGKCANAIHRKLLLFLLISVTLNVILILSLCYIYINCRNCKPPEPADPEENWSDMKESVCFPCDYIGADVTNDDTLYDLKSRSGHKLCCVKDAGLQKLVILISSKQNTEMENSDTNTETFTTDTAVNVTLTRWTNPEVAAHLYLNTTALQVERRMKFESKDAFGTAFTKEVKLVNGSLQVPHHGYYFVYSSVTFKVDEASQSPDANKMYHVISRKHPKLPRTGEQLLLLDKHGPIAPGQKHTSFLCGVLKLRPGDQIQASVSNTSLVYNFALTNYLGVYLL